MRRLAILGDPEVFVAALLHGMVMVACGRERKCGGSEGNPKPLRYGSCGLGRR